MIPTLNNSSYDLTLRAIRGTLCVLVVLQFLSMCQTAFFTFAPAGITESVFQEDSILARISSVYWLVHLVIYLFSFLLLVYLFHPRLQLSRTRVVSTVTLFFVLVQAPVLVSVFSWNLQNILYGPAVATAPTEQFDWLGAAISIARYLEPAADVLFAAVLVCVILRKKLGLLTAILVGIAILGYYPIGWVLYALPYDFNDPSSVNLHAALADITTVSMSVVILAAVIALWKKIEQIVPPPPNDKTCVSCGYSTLGLKGTTCPECGGVISQQAAQAAG